jgi:hypothetical protein
VHQVPDDVSFVNMQPVLTGGISCAEISPSREG